jgi:ketosteroid isomerase-like protein
MLVNTGGVHTDIAKYYEGAFKAGLDHLEGAVHQVWPLSGDMSLATGESRITGKNESGAPIDMTIIWTAVDVDVREGGQWKIRMLTAFPKPPPPQQAAK